MKIADLTIRTRLYAGFGAMVLILVALVGVAYFNAARLAQANIFNVQSYETVGQTQAMLESLSSIQTGQRGYAITALDNFLEPMQNGKKDFIQRIARARQLTADNPQQLVRLAKLEQEQAAWLKSAIEPVLKMRRGVTAGVIQMESLVQFEQGGRGERAMGAMRGLLAEIAAVEVAQLAQRSADVAALQKLTTTMLIGGGLLATGLALTLALLLVRSIVTPLSRAVEIAKTVASGNLTSLIVVNSKDESGQLLQALKDMNDSLVRLVGQVRSGTDAIASASSEIASGNMNLSKRTEQQTSSLEETANSMEELTGTARQNASNARQASQFAVSASAIAVKGGTVVTQVVSTMQTINASSKKIVDIIAVIDSIAFQTNILALNAAVEAARAGEQGRGFAVVASEVRTLAQRSALAAKEIKVLISDSAEQVASGSKLVSQAGGTMSEIVDSVKRVNDIIAEISAASQEQIKGIDKVNHAISGMDASTQQNAALVEQAAAAAASLQEQATRQAELMSRFQLERTKPWAIATSARRVALRG